MSQSLKDSRVVWRGGERLDGEQISPCVPIEPKTAPYIKNFEFNVSDVGRAYEFSQYQEESARLAKASVHKIDSLVED